MKLEYINTIPVKVYDKKLGCNCRQTVYVIPKMATASRLIMVKKWRAYDPDHNHNSNKIAANFIR